MDLMEQLYEVCDKIKDSDMTKHQKMTAALEVASSFDFDFRQTNALVKRIIDQSISDYYNSEEYSDTFKWSVDMGVDGMIKILEEGKTPKEAFEFIKDKYDKTDEWVDKVRTSKIHNAGNILQKVESKVKTKVKKLKKQGVYDKTSLAKATTPNSQFNKAHKLITLSDRMDNMEKMIQEQQLMIMSMECRLSIAESNIADVTATTKSLTENTIKDLQSKGLSLPQISEQLDIPLRKVKYILYKK